MVLLFVPTAILSESSLRAVMLKEFSSKGESIAIAIANATEGYIAEDRDASTIQGFVDRFRHLEGVGYVFVLDNTGDTVAHTFAPEFPDAMKTAHPFVGEQDEKRLFDEKELDVPGHGLHRDIVVPLLQGRQGEVHVGMNLAVVNKQVAEATATLVFASLLAFVLAIGVVLWLADRLVRPLRLLSVWPGASRTRAT
jgi:sensor histidine kinase regulating citrate/malate metabolism